MSFSFDDVDDNTQNQHSNKKVSWGRSFSQESISSVSSDSAFSASATKINDNDKYFISIEDIENLGMYCISPTRMFDLTLPHQ